MISKVMKRKYITPVVYFFKFEEESELLANSLQDADSVSGAEDYIHNAADGNSELNVTNKSTLTQDQIGAKDHDWLFDDNAFSDSW